MHIQAYFKTEDAAEGARIGLSSYPVENLEVGRLEEKIGQSSTLLIPFAPMGNNAGTYTGGAQAPSNLGIPLIYNNEDNDRVLRSEGESEAERDLRQDRGDESDPGLTGFPIASTAVERDDYADLEYVLSGRVNEQNRDEVVDKLRKEGAYVEVLD